MVSIVQIAGKIARLNSELSDEQLFLIGGKNTKYRMYYALLFKYYEINKVFFKKTPQFSGSLITSFANKLEIPRTISEPSSNILSRYYQEIRNYFGTSRFSAKHQEFIRNYIFDILPTETSFDAELLYEKVVKYLAQNKIEYSRDSSLRSLVDSTVQI